MLSTFRLNYKFLKAWYSRTVLKVPLNPNQSINLLVMQSRSSYVIVVHLVCNRCSTANRCFHRMSHGDDCSSSVPFRAQDCWELCCSAERQQNRDCLCKAMSRSVCDCHKRSAAVHRDWPTDVLRASSDSVMLLAVVLATRDSWNEYRVAS